MSEIENVEEYEIYYYMDSKGVKLYTPSSVYASVRASHYGTDGVFIEKN